MACAKFNNDLKHKNWTMAKLFSMQVKFWGKNHQWNWSLGKFYFLYSSVLNNQIVTRFCICHDSIAVMPCEKFCNNPCIRIWMTTNWNFHWISTADWWNFWWDWLQVYDRHVHGTTAKQQRAAVYKEHAANRYVYKIQQQCLAETPPKKNADV